MYQKIKTGKNINCIICNKKFYIIKSTYKTKKFCSNKCRGTYFTGYNNVTKRLDVQNKIRNFRLGKTNNGDGHPMKHSIETRQKMKGHRKLTLHHERILQEIPELEKQGFRCVPNTKIIPDIIAIKDNKVYAIEVEYQKPDYNKYTNCKLYDDIIWIVKKTSIK